MHDLEVIGRGGFGVVYRGRQAELGREVAVKVISTPGTAGSAVERWRREVTAMGRLSNHPNIVAVYSGGVTADGSPYLVMPYVPGGSLRDRLTTDGPLSPAEVASFGSRLAAALATAHAAGVLHRDVKPDNVLLSPYGEPQLTDFGIARLLDATVTATSSVHATIPYAPPEVLAGQPATEAADVYGLGATLFACLTGAAPFPSSSEDSLVALVGRIAGQPPPDLRARGVPDALASVIERALAKTPEERIPTADELRRRLEQVSAILAGPAAADDTQPHHPPGGTWGAAGEEGDEHTSVMPVVPEATAWAQGSTGADPGTAVLDDDEDEVEDEVEPAVPPPPSGRRSVWRHPVLLAALVALLVVLAVAFEAGVRNRTGDDESADDRASATTETLAEEPATTEPETTEPETTTTAPTTTEAPTTTVPTTTTEPPPPDTSEPEGTAAAYFQALARGDLAAGYGMLTPEFRAIQSRESYERFWRPRSVEVTGQPTVDPATGRASVPVRINGEPQQFPLTMVEREGRWMVDGPRPSG